MNQTTVYSVNKNMQHELIVALLWRPCFSLPLKFRFFSFVAVKMQNSLMVAIKHFLFRVDLLI